MRLCGVSGILFSRRGEQIILLFFIYEPATRLSNRLSRISFTLIYPHSLFKTGYFRALY